MTLADAATIAGLASNLAVLVSVAYLALQLRQTRQHQLGVVRQNRAQRNVEIQLAVADPAVAEAVARGFSGSRDITATQLRQWQVIHSAILDSIEDNFFQYRAGLLDKLTFESSVLGVRGALSQAGFRAMWRRVRSGHEPNFVAFIDGLLLETPLTESEDPLARWQADVEAELESAK